MTKEILIFDKSPEAGEELAREIRGAYKWLTRAWVSLFDPEDVFNKPLPEKPRAAFFTISNMYEAEAMRKFNALADGVPLIMISDSWGYCLWSWRENMGTRYYIKRPIEKNELLAALNRCALDIPIAGSY